MLSKVPPTQRRSTWLVLLSVRAAAAELAAPRLEQGPRPGPGTAGAGRESAGLGAADARDSLAVQAEAGAADCGSTGSATGIAIMSTTMTPQ
mmetsp:Transcript_92609/g.261883  ORF Transcript_92609/g.261883 Transcript_92609/m.261883 type:complete len:92 (+) Transcript_92609:385-660(+)